MFEALTAVHRGLHTAWDYVRSHVITTPIQGHSRTLGTPVCVLVELETCQTLRTQHFQEC